MHVLRSAFVACVVFCIAAAPANAQAVATPGLSSGKAVVQPEWRVGVYVEAADSVRAPSPWRPLRVAKWSVAAGAGAAAAVGFINNRRADEAFQDLERWCQDNTTACTDRLPSGAYRDATAEAEYQRIRSLDGRARAGLIAAQVGVAAGVVLFILDLRNQQPPPNIPYEPRRLQVGGSADSGISVGVRMPASFLQAP